MCPAYISRSEPMTGPANRVEGNRCSVPPMAELQRRHSTNLALSFGVLMPET